MRAPKVLVVAGLDPAGLAGLFADAEAVRAAGARPLLCAASTTLQTSRTVHGHFPIPAEVLERQIRFLAEEEGIDAVKLGMLGSVENARMLARLLREPPFSQVPWVVDPVLRASAGPPLFDGDAAEYRGLFRPNAVLTPNLAEAAALAGLPLPEEEEGMRACGTELLAAGAGAVVVTGGHLAGAAVDLLCRTEGVVRFEGDRLPGRRGTGCRLASALAAGLARGLGLPEALDRARGLVRHYLAHGKLPAEPAAS
ncbi:MAG: PfkB family carbohydrate kinase [Pseudomonadota bacterium]